MGGPPMGPGGPGPGPGEDVTIEDLMAALKQLPEELLRQLVSELMTFLEAGAEPAGPPGPPGPPEPPGMPGGAGPGIAEAAKARAGV